MAKDKDSEKHDKETKAGLRKLFKEITSTPKKKGKPGKDDKRGK